MDDKEKQEEVKNAEQEKQPSKKSPTIPGQKKEAEFFKDTPETKIQTIMPTMIDASEEHEEKKRDLSSIIPQFNDDSNAEATELISQDDAFKSDASITLAYVNDAGEVTISNGAKLPEQIDMEQRKKEIAESKNVRRAKKKEKKDRRKARRSQKQQNIVSIGALCVIIALGIFAYWFFTHKTEMDFEPKYVVVELGDELPAHKSSYVTPGVGTTLEDIFYTLDLSKVVLEETGEYPFTVTYKGSTKKGTVLIQDTKPPELNVRTVTITEGGTYTASTFVDLCRDPSGCNFSFQDSETEKKYNTAGSYVVYVVATDAFQNSTTKKASLIIEAQGNVRRYTKYVQFDQQLGYELTESYELHFRATGADPVLLNGTRIKEFKYQDAERYEKARKDSYGEQGFTCYDSEKKIIYKESANVVGNNYSSGSDIDNYLLSVGFTRES